MVLIRLTPQSGWISPQLAVEAARARARARVPGAGLEFVRADARSFSTTECFALGACLGSTHALGGLDATLSALAATVRSGGSLLVGDGYWREEPSPTYLETLGGATRDELSDLPGLVDAGRPHGLRPVAVRTASEDDWDACEWELIANGDAYATARPDEPGVNAVVGWIDRARARVRSSGGRETLGFALVLLRVP